MTAPGIRSYMQIFSRFGLTWHRKVNFSTFSGKLTFQSTRNGLQNLPFCPGPLQDTFIIFSSISHQHVFRKYFSNKNPKNRKLEIHGCPWMIQGSPYGSKLTFEKTDLDHFPARVFLDCQFSICSKIVLLINISGKYVGEISRKK